MTTYEWSEHSLQGQQGSVQDQEGDWKCLGNLHILLALCTTFTPCICCLLRLFHSTWGLRKDDFTIYLNFHIQDWKIHKLINSVLIYISQLLGRLDDGKNIVFSWRSCVVCRWRMVNCLNVHVSFHLLLPLSNDGDMAWDLVSLPQFSHMEKENRDNISIDLTGLF
jgi:hypothetical protein